MAQASFSTGARSHLLPDAYGPGISTVTLSGLCHHQAWMKKIRDFEHLKFRLNYLILLNLKLAQAGSE